MRRAVDHPVADNGSGVVPGRVEHGVAPDAPDIRSRARKQSVTVSPQRTAILGVEICHAAIVHRTTYILNRPDRKGGTMPLTDEQKAARAAKRRMTQALKEEARAHREEARRREWVEKGMYLTREEAAAGEPCRACGLPVIDNLGSWPGTMYLSPEERIEYDAAEARFKEMHPDCESHRWSMSGSRATHCGFCCPPIPFSDAQLEAVAQIFRNSTTREEDLDIWERTLTCGHTIQRTVHHTNSSPSFSTEHCEQCEITRGVVSSEKIVDAASRQRDAQRKRDEQVAKAEREVAKAEKAAREARRKLDELRAGGS